ncbi:MAG: hypothetical protein ACI9QL_002905 [Candidatus Omnitrophota bacterium]|jgi:hypothetical protein
MNKNFFSGLLIAFFISAFPAFSADKHFDDEGGDALWSKLLNWSDDTLPDAQTVIAGGFTSRVEVADSFSGFGPLYVGGTTEAPNGPGTLIVDGTLLVDGGIGEAIIGSNQRPGTLMLNPGSSFTTTNRMLVGRNSGGGGLVEIGTNVILTVGSNLLVSSGGVSNNVSNGMVNQTGGQVVLLNPGSDLNIGQASFSSGTYRLSGGRIDLDRNMNLGNNNTGEGNLHVSGTSEINAGQHLHFRRGLVTIDGGAVRAGRLNPDGDVNIAVDNTDVATVHVTGGVLQAADQLAVGRNNTNSVALLTVDGGTIASGRNLVIPSGTVRLTNGLIRVGTLDPAGDLVIGQIGNAVAGTMSMEGGELQIADTFFLRLGSMTQTDGRISVGTSTNTADFNVGPDTGSLSSYVMEGGLLEVVDNLNISRADQTGEGSVLLSGGTISVGRSVTVQSGTSIQSNGVFRISTLVGNGSFNVGTSTDSVGTFILAGGSLDSANTFNLGQNIGTGVGFLEVRGGQLTTTNVMNMRNGGVIQTGGMIAAGGNISFGATPDNAASFDLFNGVSRTGNQFYIGQSVSNGVATVNVYGGRIQSDSHFQVRRGELNVAGGTVIAGANLNISVDIGGGADLSFLGGTIIASNVLTIGRSDGLVDPLVTIYGGGGLIQSGGNTLLRSNATLRTVIDLAGVTRIETLNDGADIALNRGSTWDVDLAGGVYVSATSSNEAFRAKDAIFSNLTTFDEPLWDKVLSGATGDAEPRILNLVLAGSSLGSIVIGQSTVIAGANTGWLNLDGLGGQTLEILIDVSVSGGATIAELAQHMIDAGYAVRVVDADTLAITVTPADSAAFFGFDFSDFDAENASATAVNAVSAISGVEGPLLTIERVAPTVNRVRFDSASGVNYQLESRESLAIGTWADEGMPVSGTGAAVDLLQTNAVPRGVYRVRILP